MLSSWLHLLGFFGNSVRMNHFRIRLPEMGILLRNPYLFRRGWFGCVSVYYVARDKLLLVLLLIITYSLR